VIPPDLGLGVETEPEMKEKPEPEPTGRLGKEHHQAKVPIGKLFLSALASRLFFPALLPIILGAVVKPLFCHVSPERAD